MADKVLKLNLERNYSRYLYFIDGDGNVCRKSKNGGDETTEVLLSRAITRDSDYLYFVDRDGDVARSARAVRRGGQR